MSQDLRAQLQATLSGTHTLEQELGGGGMSKVFLAEETRLGRKVVVKVLSPELAQGLSVERCSPDLLDTATARTDVSSRRCSMKKAQPKAYTREFRENARLREGREILRKATAFFAKEGR